jgi:hypothetical protein
MGMLRALRLVRVFRVLLIAVNPHLITVIGNFYRGAR